MTCFDDRWGDEMSRDRQYGRFVKENISKTP
jgi:hypothetical protein